MKPLSKPLADLKPEYDVLVIGSGYGGAIAAHTLAGSRKGVEERNEVSVCLFERGKEIRSGDFPNTSWRAFREMQVHTGRNRFGSPTGLYDFRVGPHVSVVQGCGLGGGSLINASVVLPPTDEVLETLKPRTKVTPAEWETYFSRIRDGLCVSRYPSGRGCEASEDADGEASGVDGEASHADQWPRLHKLTALEEVGVRKKQCVRRPHLAVTFAPATNWTGVAQRPCTLCGDCVSGCNHTAKNTLDKNYLYSAQQRGAEIFCEVQVQRIEPAPGSESGDEGWLVFFVPLNTGRRKYDPPEMFVRAKVVVLGAGSLGSTEILLRSSKAHGGRLDLSKRLGEKFSGNGDTLAWAYNNDRTIRGIGLGPRIPTRAKAVGPTITGMIDLRSRDPGILIEEGAIPGALATPLRFLFPLVAKFVGRDSDEGFVDGVREFFREVASVIGGAFRGAMKNTQTYLVMAHDASTGSLALVNDRVRVVWPRVGHQPVYDHVNEELEKATFGGIHVINPMWSRYLDRRTATVHPLGGCPVGANVGEGVVDPSGKVFQADGPCYEGLYVCDGSVLPQSLGANPLLLISAVALRTAEHLAGERDWTLAASRSPDGGDR